MKEGDLENFNNPMVEKNKKKRRVLILHIDYPESGDFPLHKIVKSRATLRIKERKEQISTEVKSITINGANSLNDSVSDFFNWLKEGSTSESEEPPILEIIHHGFNPDREETEEVRSGAYLGKKLCKHVDFEEFGYFELNAISCFFARENNEGISQLDQLLIELMKHGAKHFVGCGSRETISMPLKEIKETNLTESDLNRFTKSGLDYVKELDIYLKENESDFEKLLDKLEEQVISRYETFEKLLIDYNKSQKKYDELERERTEANEAFDNFHKSFNLHDNKILESLIDLSSELLKLKRRLRIKKYQGFFFDGKFDGKVVTEKDVKDAELNYNKAYSQAIGSITDPNELATIVNYMKKLNKRNNSIYEFELQENLNDEKYSLKNKAYEAYNEKKDLLEFYLRFYYYKSFSLLRDKYPNIKMPAGYDFHLRQIKTKDGRFKGSGAGIRGEVGPDGNFVADVYYSPTLDSEQPQLVKILTPDGLKAFIEMHKAAANQRNSGQSSELNSWQSAQNSRTP